MTKLWWTELFHGVQHLRGIPALDGAAERPRTHQISVNQYGSITTAHVLALKSLHPFTAIAEETFPTVEEAREWAENKARELS